MIPIPHKKYALGKRLKVRISKQEKLKSFILKHPMSTPRKHVLFLEFLLPLLIERWNIKNFVPSLIANLEHLFHFEDVNFETKTNDRHHLA